MFTYCAAVMSAKTNDTHLDRFLVQWVYSPQCTTKHDPTIQHPPHKFDLVLAEATSRYNSQVEKDTEVSPTIWMGHQAYICKWV
jgi:hypothetical protein